MDPPTPDHLDRMAAPLGPEQWGGHSFRFDNWYLTITLLLGITWIRNEWHRHIWLTTLTCPSVWSLSILWHSLYTICSSTACPQEFFISVRFSDCILWIGRSGFKVDSFLDVWLILLFVGRKSAGGIISSTRSSRQKSHLISNVLYGMQRPTELPAFFFM